MFPVVVEQPGRCRLPRQRAHHRREAVRPRSGLGARAERDAAQYLPEERRSSASITTSARRRCRTCCTSASPTRCSSRCGTAITSRTCRSRWPNLRRRGPRQVLRRDRRDPRRDPEPPVPGAQLLAMEAPSSTGAEAIRDEQAKVLRNVRPLNPERRRARPVPRLSRRGRRRADSQVPTYAALRLHVDSWRWQGVPFFVRAGKKLAGTCTEVRVELKPRAARGLRGAAAAMGNYVRFRLGPEVAIARRRDDQGAGREPGRPARRAVGRPPGCRRRHGRLRAPARRRDAGRRDAVRAPGRRRSGVGDRRSADRRDHRRCRSSTRRAAGGRRKPTIWSPTSADGTRPLGFRISDFGSRI